MRRKRDSRKKMARKKRSKELLQRHRILIAKHKRLLSKVRQFWMHTYGRCGMWEQFEEELKDRVPEMSILAQGIKSRLNEVIALRNDFKKIFGDDVYKPLLKRLKRKRCR